MPQPIPLSLTLVAALVVLLPWLLAGCARNEKQEAAGSRDKQREARQQEGPVSGMSPQLTESIKVVDSIDERLSVCASYGSQQQASNQGLNGKIAFASQSYLSVSVDAGAGHKLRTRRREAQTFDGRLSSGIVVFETHSTHTLQRVGLTCSYTSQLQRAIQLRFLATIGPEPEIELALV